MAAQCATEVNDNPLWNFALAFYASKDVQELLLKLQNDCQQDTLLILSALWLASEGRGWQLNLEQLQDYYAWRENVIWSLRTARKAIAKNKNSGEQLALRQQIQQDEIRAEQIALHQLYLLHTKLPCQNYNSQRVLENLVSQSELVEISCRKKEALQPLLQQLAGLLTHHLSHN